MDIDKDAWSPALTVGKLMLSLRSLLTDPNPHDPMVPEWANLFMKDREKYDQMAEEWTKKYAM